MVNEQAAGRHPRWRDQWVIARHPEHGKWAIKYYIAELDEVRWYGRFPTRKAALTFQTDPVQPDWDIY